MYHSEKLLSRRIVIGFPAIHFLTLLPDPRPLVVSAGEIRVGAVQCDSRRTDHSVSQSAARAGDLLNVVLYKAFKGVAASAALEITENLHVAFPHKRIQKPAAS